MYNISNVECYNCYKRGHYANEYISKGDNHAANCAQEDSNHEQDEEDHVVLMKSQIHRRVRCARKCRNGNRKWREKWEQQALPHTQLLSPQLLGLH